MSISIEGVEHGSPQYLGTMCLRSVEMAFEGRTGGVDLSASLPPDSNRILSLWTH